jgi:hypothetical protein
LLSNSERFRISRLEKLVGDYTAHKGELAGKQRNAIHEFLGWSGSAAF